MCRIESIYQFLTLSGFSRTIASFKYNQCSSYHFILVKQQYNLWAFYTSDKLVNADRLKNIHIYYLQTAPAIKTAYILIKHCSDTLKLFPCYKLLLTVKSSVQQLHFPSVNNTKSIQFMNFVNIKSIEHICIAEFKQ